MFSSSYIAFTSFFLVFAVASAFASNLPEYTVKRATGKILIDGILNEPDWEAAESVGPFVFNNYTSGEQEQTEVKLLWDDEFLYVAFKCDDKWISANHFNTNDPVSRDDCVEIFWNPDPASHSLYYQFEINCIGNSLNVYRDKDGRRIHINPPYKGQTINGTVNDDSDIDTGWIMEVAIRFSDYPELWSKERPEPGDMWRVGLNRCGGVTNPQFSQWSPTVWGPGTKYPRYTFHAPEYFGKIYFSDESVIPRD